MKTLFLIVAALVLSLQNVNAQGNYTSTKGFVSFYSKAPVADVDARNENVKVELNHETSTLNVSIKMTDFQWKNEKMGRDARKKYLETDKFSTAGFKGKIQGKVNYDKPGTYNATATGKLKIHGVEKDITEKGTITVADGGQVKLQSEFNVALADYNIETPKILGQEMTEDKVLVKIEVTFKSPKNVASKSPDK